MKYGSIRHGTTCKAVLLLTAMLVFTAVPAFAQECCDDMKESYADYPQFPNIGDNCNTYRLEQSFSPTESYLSCAARAVLNTGSGQATAVFRLQDGLGDGANILAQGSAIVGTNERWTYFDLVPDVNLVADQTYYIRITGDVFWRRHEGVGPPPYDPYPRGQAYRDGVAYPFPPDTDDHDFWFQTLAYRPGVCAPEPVPTLSEWGLMFLVLLLATSGAFVLVHRRRQRLA